MNIAIVGFGKFSKELTKQLLSEKHNIVIIDKDSEIVDDAVNQYDVKGYTGNGASIEVLKNAEIEHFDMLVAQTSSDEVNVLSCLVAKKLGIKYTVARVRTIEYMNQANFLQNDLGISLVLNSDLICAKEIANIIKFPKALKIETFTNNKTQLIELKVDQESPFLNLKLSEIRNTYECKVLVCAVQRGEDALIPKGDFELLEGDIIYVSIDKKDVQKLFKKLKMQQGRIQSVILIGGGRLAYYLATSLIDDGINVKIIEKDKDVCTKLNSVLPEAIVLNADGNDQDLLIEEGMNKSAFVCVTGIDETNILLSSFAKNHGALKVITKLSNSNYDEAIDNLGLDTVVSPKKSFVENVTRYIRKIENNRSSECESLHFLLDSKLEALEFNVFEEAKYTSKPIKELKISNNVLIAAISRDNEVIIPTGDDTIEKGDSVILVSQETNILDLSQVIE